MDSGVEGYIRRQKSAGGKICIGLRALILEMFPGIREGMRMGVPWYGDRFYIAAFSDHVNLGLCIDGLTAKERASLDGAGRFMGHIKAFTDKGIDRERIRAILRSVKRREKKK